MKVFCKEKNELDVFIKKCVELVLDKYGDDINTSSIEEIELVDLSYVGYETDGRFVMQEKKIYINVIPCRSFPTLDLNILMDNKDFKSLINTLLHEMGHASDLIFMPNLYKTASDINNIENMIAPHFWLEYLAEKRSSKRKLVDFSDFCNEFISIKWKITKFDLESATFDNFFYLTKALEYFMGRTTEKADRNFYLSNIKDNLLKDYINKLSEELLALEEIGLFDSTDNLENLKNIILHYKEEFMSRKKD